jgi:hypothetical protein
MSASEFAGPRSDVVSLADEEGVRQVLVDSVLGLCQQSHAAQTLLA